MDITKFLATPAFQLKGVDCECMLTWITREPPLLVGAPKAYELAVVVDWEKCTQHNPDLKGKHEYKGCGDNNCEFCVGSPKCHDEGKRLTGTLLDLCGKSREDATHS